jgi:hypothetical protein
VYVQKAPVGSYPTGFLAVGEAYLMGIQRSQSGQCIRSRSETFSQSGDWPHGCVTADSSRQVSASLGIPKVVEFKWAEEWSGPTPAAPLVASIRICIVSTAFTRVLHAFNHLKRLVWCRYSNTESEDKHPPRQFIVSPRVSLRRVSQTRAVRPALPGLSPRTLSSVMQPPVSVVHAIRWPGGSSRL